MRYIYTLFIVLICSGMYSQSSVVSGIITDKKTGETLIGVAIIFEDNTGIVTNDKGIYEIKINDVKEVKHIYRGIVSLVK